MFHPNLKDGVISFQNIHSFTGSYANTMFDILSVIWNKNQPAYFFKYPNAYFRMHCSAEQSKSTSTTGRHLLANQACAYEYNPSMFIILEISTNELQLYIMKTLLITKHKPVPCIQKQFYTPLLFSDPLGPAFYTINTITCANSSSLRWISFISFLPRNSWFFLWSPSHTSSTTHSIVTDIIFWKEVIETKYPFCLRI